MAYKPRKRKVKKNIPEGCAHKFSKKAIEKIEKSGSSYEVI